MNPKCTRCKRELREWPLERGDKCAPKRWVYCIRPIRTPTEDQP